MIRSFKFQLEHLEDRNAPGSLLEGFTPLAMWGTDLPLLNALNASSVVRPAAETVQGPLAVDPVYLSEPTALKTQAAEQVAAIAEPVVDATLVDVIGAVGDNFGGTIQGPGAIRPGFDTGGMLPSDCDDCRSTSTPLGFTFTLGSVTFDSLHVYSNGILNNIPAIGVGQIGSDPPLDTYGPATGVIIAGFWGDVDLNGGGAVRWGQGDVDGNPAWGATWDSVGYYNAHGDLLNTFQIVIIDLTSVKGGYLLEFNYGSIQWQAGDAFPTLPPRVGFTDGNGTVAEIFGSGMMDTLTDASDSGLIYYDDGYFVGGSGVAGRHQVNFI